MEKYNALKTNPAPFSVGFSSTAESSPILSWTSEKVLQIWRLPGASKGKQSELRIESE